MKTVYPIKFKVVRFFYCALLLFVISGQQAFASADSTTFDYFIDEGPIEDPVVALHTFENKSAADATIRAADMPFNDANVDRYYWFHARVSNHSDKALTRFVLLAVPYRQLLDVYSVDQGGEVRQLLRESVEQPFTARGSSHRWLVSKPLTIAPKQSVDVLLRYHAIGSSYLPISIVDESMLNNTIQDDTVSAAVFYSFSVAAIFLFLLFGIAMQDRTSVWYAMLFLVALLMLSAMEGYAFMYLWPGFPRWNHYSALVLIYSFCAMGFYVAYKAVEPSQQKQTLSPTVRRVFLVSSFVSLLMLLMFFVLPFELLVDLSNAFVVLMFLAHAFAIVSWSRVDSLRLLKRNMIAMIAAVLIAVVAVVLVLLSFDVDFLPATVYVNASRIIFILAGLATMATIIAHVSGLRQDYAIALENEVAAAQREAKINHELYLAEQEYARVKALASLRQRKLAEASHDMRQPLISLRSTIDAITFDESASLKTQLANAFNYLENLCTTYLAETRPETETEDQYVDDQDVLEQDVPANSESAPTEEESYAVDLIFNTVQRMFEQEASAKGIELKISASSVQLTQPPTLIMRIVSNLVSNAIKHSEAGRILLGVRRSVSGAVIAVIDNGVGLSDELQQTIMQAYEKGPESSGEGLGLAICKQLADQSGMQLEIISQAGKGSCFLLHISRQNEEKQA